MKWSFILMICTGCITGPGLNKQIFKSQIQSGVNSPFETRGAANVYPKVQYRVRDRYIKTIDSLLSAKPNDTILLVETFNYICVNCPADIVELWTKENYIKLSQVDSAYGEYKEKVVRLDELLYYGSSSMYEDVELLKGELRLGIKWWNQPELYGTDVCSDGSHTFYTIFIEDSIHTMYMRCWKSEL